MEQAEATRCQYYGDRGCPSLAAGLLALVVGTVLLLNSLEVVDLWGVLRYWPVLLIIIGALMLWRNLRGQPATR